MMNQTPYSYIPNTFLMQQMGTEKDKMMELEERMNRLERQVKRLENKVFHTEQQKESDYSIAPPKENGMYMM